MLWWGGATAALPHTTRNLPNQPSAGLKDNGLVASTLKPDPSRQINSTLYVTLQDAVNAAAGQRLKIFGIHTISTSVIINSNTEICFDGQAMILTSMPDISFFYAKGKSHISIRGGRFKQLCAGNKAYVAGVRLDNCIFCTVEDNVFEGMQWSGIHFNGTTDSRISGNHIKTSLDSVAGDKFDIVLYHSHRNIINGNSCLGGQNGGILIQDPLGSGLDVPSHNKIVDNIVGSAAVPMNAYGIVLYLGGSRATFHEILGNRVENIKGDPLVQLATGTGIYCVGSGIGGLIVRNNVVRNACQLTKQSTNGPAGITIADVRSVESRPVVANNVVDGMSQAHGILLVSSSGGAVIERNIVRIPASNNGAGSGGIALAGNGIRIFNTSNAIVSNNTVEHSGTSDAILCLTTAGNCDKIEIIANTAFSAGGNAIRIDRTDRYEQSNIKVIGNQLEARSRGGLISIAGTDSVLISGNTGSANCGTALSLVDARRTRISGNVLQTSATNSVTIRGRCEGSHFQRDNVISGKIDNQATGMTLS